MADSLDGIRLGLVVMDEIQTFGPLDGYKVRLRRGADDHIHQFPAKEPLTVPHQYLPCECGETLGGGHEDGPETRRS